MVSWVIDKIDSYQGQSAALNYKFDVAMSGVLGFGNDLRKWTDADKEIAKTKIALYKTIRPIVQQGVLHRLVSPFEHNRCALQYNTADKKQSVLFCYNMATYLPGSQLIDRGSSILKLKGLNPDKQYLVKNSADSKDKGSAYSGRFLMDIGLGWPVKNAYDSRILLINQTN